MRWQLAQYFEGIWWDRYLRGKPVDNYLDWKKDYWNALIERLSPALSLKQTDHILDAGCGPAGVFLVLNQAVTAIDPLFDRYKERLKHFTPDTRSSVTFRKQRIEDLEDVESFDAVFCMNAINHVEDIEAAVERMIRTCKKGGTIVMSIDAHNHAWAKPIYRAVPFDILHPHQYDLNEYAAMLEDYSIKVIKKELIKSGFWFDHYVLVGTRV